MRNKEEIRLNLATVRTEAKQLMNNITILIEMLDKVETEEDCKKFDEMAAELTKFKHIDVL